MPDSTSQVGLIVSARDKATAVIEKIGKSAEAAFTRIKAHAKDVKKGFEKMPEQFGKAASAMFLFQGATGRMGGEVADAANKLTAVAALVATGGPLGVAMAGLTAATIGVSAVMKTLNADLEATASAQRSLDVVFNETNNRIVEQRNRLLSLQEQLKFFGKTQEEINKLKQQEAVAAQSVSIPLVEKSISQIERQIEALKAEKAEREKAVIFSAGQEAARSAAIAGIDKEIKSLKGQQEALRKSIEQGKTIQEGRKNEINTIDALIKKQDEQIKATKRAMIAEREREDARKRAEAIKLQDAKNFAAAINGLGQQTIAINKLIEDITEENDEKEKERQKRKREDFVRLGAAMGDVTADIIANAESASDAFNKLGKAALSGTIDIARQIVITKAVEAAAGAGSFAAALGPFGIAAAASLAFGIVKGLLKKLPGKAEGGLITGGTPGQDSVVARLMPGERVLTVQQNKTFEKLARAVLMGGTATGGALQSGGMVTRSTGSGAGLSVHITAQIANPSEMTREQIDRWLINMSSRIESLHRDGLFLRTVPVG